jgi:predicted flap endonuclease-1-like 5' DNA nuclease
MNDAYFALLCAMGIIIFLFIKKVISKRKRTQDKPNAGNHVTDDRQVSGRLPSLSEADVEKNLKIIKKLGQRNGDDVDDLKKISGVGPVYENALHSIGIYTYAQISKLDSESITALENLTRYFKGRISKDDWKGQAKRLMEES